MTGLPFFWAAGQPCTKIERAAWAGYGCCMFEGFANVWTPVTLSKRLETKPLSLTVAGEPVVFFRDGDGKV